MPENQFLAALPAEERAQMERYLKPVSLEQNDVLSAVGQPVKDVFLMDGAVCSLIMSDADGATAEAGMVGVEGIVNAVNALGWGVSYYNGIVQLPGPGRTMPAPIFARLWEDRPALRRATMRYLHYLLAQTSQTALCNRAHTLDQRLARWLLISSDATQSDHLPLTQEFLGSMLGVQRPGVTMAARSLQDNGLIRYSRGNITITDHGQLAASACECYHVNRENLNALFTA